MPGLVPGIHVLAAGKEDVDGGVEPGHDEKLYPVVAGALLPRPTAPWYGRPAPAFAADGA